MDSIDKSQQTYQTLWSNHSSINTSSNFDCLQDPLNKPTTDILKAIVNHTLLIYPWVMIIIGTISNSLSYLVFTKPKLKKSSTFLYLSFLCIVDLITIYTFCINFIFLYQLKV